MVKWDFQGHIIILEVKTTDAYRIDLNKLAEYRKVLIRDETITEKDSSVLIVVGRKDTGDLEAQIRGMTGEPKRLSKSTNTGVNTFLTLDWQRSFWPACRLMLRMVLSESKNTPEIGGQM